MVVRNQPEKRSSHSPDSNGQPERDPGGQSYMVRQILLAYHHDWAVRHVINDTDHGQQYSCHIDVVRGNENR